MDLTLNLLLYHVILTDMTTHSSKSMDSATVKRLHTNSSTCHFAIFTQRFRSVTLVA